MGTTRNDLGWLFKSLLHALTVKREGGVEEGPRGANMVLCTDPRQDLLYPRGVRFCSRRLLNSTRMTDPRLFIQRPRRFPEGSSGLVRISGIVGVDSEEVRRAVTELSTGLDASYTTSGPSLSPRHIGPLMHGKRGFETERVTTPYSLYGPLARLLS